MAPFEMPITHGLIYGLRDPETLELRYVGQTVQPLRNRVRGHVRAARTGSEHPVAAWIRSLGTEPNAVILERCRVEQLFSAEREWIAYESSLGCRLTNVRKNGQEYTAQHRERISHAMQGKRKSAEHKTALSESLRGQKRGPMPEARRRAISESKRGKKQPGISAAKMGHPVSMETRAKISEAFRRRREERTDGHQDDS